MDGIPLFGLHGTQEFKDIESAGNAAAREIQREMAKQEDCVKAMLYYLHFDSIIAQIDSIAACKSPIEKLFALACSRLVQVDNWSGRLSRMSGANHHSFMTPKYIASLHPQFKIGKFFVDFLLFCNDCEIIVECDGYEFHRATQNQTTKEYEREHQLIAHNRTILRFTGSQIYANPFHCANVAADTLCRAALAHDALLREAANA